MLEAHLMASICVSSNRRRKTVNINKTKAHANTNTHTPFRRTFILTVQPALQFLYKIFSFNVTASLLQHLHVCRHMYCDHLLLDVEHRRCAHEVTAILSGTLND